MAISALAALLALCAGSALGGVVLEDAATGIPPVKTAEYKQFEARGRPYRIIVLDDRLAYSPPIPLKDFAVLCRSLAKDDRAGVSLVGGEIVYGAIPKDSDIANDLELADLFLGDIVFAKNDWSAGYKFPDGYVPLDDPNPGHLAVFMKFYRPSFAGEGDALKSAGVKFEITLVPLSQEKAPDGGGLPDYEAIKAQRWSKRFESNAIHVSSHFEYYLKEPIVAQATRYGEAAGFIRALRNGGVDVVALADQIDKAAGKPTRAKRRSLEKRWGEYLKRIQAAGDYANWSAPPYELWKTRRSAP